MLRRAAKTTDWRTPIATAASAFNEIRMAGLGKTVEPSVDEEMLKFLIVPQRYPIMFNSSKVGSGWCTCMSATEWRRNFASSGMTKDARGTCDIPQGNQSPRRSDLPRWFVTMHRTCGQGSAARMRQGNTVLPHGACASCNPGVLCSGLFTE